MSNSEKPLDKLRPNNKWFSLKGINNRDDESKGYLIERLLSCQDLFDVIKAYIGEKREEVLKSEEEIEDFNDPAWPQKQAYRAGKRAAYREVEEFLPDPKKHQKSE